MQSPNPYLSTFVGIVWIVTVFILPGATASAQKQERAGQETASSLDAGILKQLEGLDLKITEKESRRDGLSVDLARAEARAAEIGQGLESLREEMQPLKNKLNSRLVALYKFRQIGYALYLFSADGIKDVAGAEMLADQVLQDDNKLLAQAGRDKDRMKALQDDVSRSGAEIEQLKRGLANIDREIASVKSEKSGLLAQVNQHESLYGSYQNRVEENQKTLEKRAFSRKPIFTQYAQPFSTRKASLPLPVQGEIVETFGGKVRAPSQTILYNGGIVIYAPKGQSVRSIHEGIVVFADWFKEYGKVMIVDHGDHYYSLIAHADQLLKKVGEIVKAEEVIATVGNTGSLDGPKLYFEIRHYGEPVDPKEWFAFQNISKQ